MTRRETLPRLHVVTNDRIVAAAGFVETAEAVLRRGGPRLALHLRAPGLNGRRLFDVSEVLGEVARATGALLLINDRVDVALAVEAGGVQLGRRSLVAEEARRLVGARKWIGASVHTVEEGRAALAAGADFVLAGTLYESVSHPGRRGAGVGWLQEIAPEAGRVIGIGGITPQRVPDVVAAGAHGVAAIRAIWEARRPEDALDGFMDALYARNCE